MSADDSQFGQNDRRAAPSVSEVAERLEAMINTGELVGGDRVNESALAQMLGTGRAPVREACRALEQIGLMRSVVNRGFFVAEIGLKEAMDLYEIRAGLMRTAGRLLVERIAPDQLAALQDAVARMEAAAATQDFEHFYLLNDHFHMLMFEAADNPKLLEMWSRLQTQLNLYRGRSLVVSGALKRANDEHAAIVEALVRGDVTGVEVVCERHGLSGKTRLLNALRAQPLGTRRRRTTGKSDEDEG